MRALAFCALAVAVGAAALVSCGPEPPRPCVNPSGQPVVATEVSSPALECPSHICLLQPPHGSTAGSTQDGGSYRAMCTQRCQQDSDCSNDFRVYCTTGLACAIATDAGPFCCQKLCICKSDLVEGVNVDADGGTTIPFSCSTANPQPSCANAPVASP